MTGLEPATPWSQTRCATICATSLWFPKCQRTSLYKGRMMTGNLQYDKSFCWLSGFIPTFNHSLCTPNRNRTYNLRIRSALLYPIELWVQLSGRVKPPHHLRAGSPASFSQLFFRSLSGEVELPHHLWAGCPTSFSQLLLRLYFKELYKDTKYSLNIQIYYEIFLKLFQAILTHKKVIICHRYSLPMYQLTAAESNEVAITKG